MNHIFLQLAKFFIVVSILFNIYSCKNINGEIEIRGNNAYLVNTSSEIQYQFTVKKTEIKNDSLYTYSTEIIELAPGDEELLGVIFSKSAIKYPTLEKAILYTYDIFSKKSKKSLDSIKKAKEEKLLISADPFVELDKIRENEIKMLPDTFINGQRLKYQYIQVSYSDTLHPYPIDIYKIKYKVTGQNRVKNI